MPYAPYTGDGKPECSNCFIPYGEDNTENNEKPAENRTRHHKKIPKQLVIKHISSPSIWGRFNLATILDVKINYEVNSAPQEVY
jgi:hypothetical protein